MSPEEIRDYANRYLQDDIAILEVREAADRFHARYKAVGKTYQYTCFDGPVKPVFDRKYLLYANGSGTGCGSHAGSGAFSGRQTRLQEFLW